MLTISARKLPRVAPALAAALLSTVLSPARARADEPSPSPLPSLSPPLSPAPSPAPAKSDDGQRFAIDPVVDGLLVVGGATFNGLLSRILSTGEIKPQPPQNPDRLLPIDRYAVNQTIDPHAGRNSDYGLYLGYTYVFADTILSGVRNGRRALLVDAVLYAEAIAITSAFTQATKIGVRRPRPVDYKNCFPDDKAPGCDDTDLQLSFFSGHASSIGTVSATATYLAFVRSGWRSPRPWITLAAGTLLTAFVSYERVRAGEHFPTDVIMGSMAGAGIGVLVPHLHRKRQYHADPDAPPLLIGFAPSTSGGQVTMQLRF